MYENVLCFVIGKSSITAVIEVSIPFEYSVLRLSYHDISPLCWKKSTELVNRVSQVRVFENRLSKLGRPEREIRESYGSPTTCDL